MSQVTLKQQMLNYSALFKQLFSDYYGHQKKLFWLIQLLMIVSTVSGLIWILSIVLGISHYQNPTQTTGLKFMLVSWMFALPMWQWLGISALAGVISAWSMYWSIKIGVESVLAYQKYLSMKCLTIVSDKKYRHWTAYFYERPHIILLRILRQGVQLTGLVSRRITRVFVSLMTFILALVVLLYMDKTLLMLLLPLSLIYIAALYFINRYAARVSTQMADILPKSAARFAQLVKSVLNKTTSIDDRDFALKYDQSNYMLLARLKYQKRLAEVHVSWLNTLFLVLGITLIIVHVIYIQAAEKIDWQHLLLFLIALNYAVSSLQQLSGASVAFSRFIPEVKLVFRLLSIVDEAKPINKVTVNTHALIFMHSSCIESFEIEQLKTYIDFNEDVQIVTINDLKKTGMIKSLQGLEKSENQCIVIDNNHSRMKRTITNNKALFERLYSHIIVFGDSHDKIEKMTIETFLRHQFETHENYDSFDADAFE